MVAGALYGHCYHAYWYYYWYQYHFEEVNAACGDMANWIPGFGELQYLHEQRQHDALIPPTELAGLERKLKELQSRKQDGSAMKFQWREQPWALDECWESWRRMEF
jgi:hypothetical protein